jgi:hypothetical protein
MQIRELRQEGIDMYKIVTRFQVFKQKTDAQGNEERELIQCDKGIFTYRPADILSTDFPSVESALKAIEEHGYMSSSYYVIPVYYKEWDDESR